MAQIDWEKVTEIYVDKHLNKFFAYQKVDDESFQLTVKDYPDAIRWSKINRILAGAREDIMYRDLLKAVEEDVRK